jgi:hypothetical protein
VGLKLLQLGRSSSAGLASAGCRSAAGSRAATPASYETVSEPMCGARGTQGAMWTCLPAQPCGQPQPLTTLLLWWWVLRVQLTSVAYLRLYAGCRCVCGDAIRPDLCAITRGTHSQKLQRSGGSLQHSVHDTLRVGAVPFARTACAHPCSPGLLSHPGRSIDISCTLRRRLRLSAPATTPGVPWD